MPTPSEPIVPAPAAPAVPTPTVTPAAPAKRESAVDRINRKIAEAQKTPAAPESVKPATPEPVKPEAVKTPEPVKTSEDKKPDHLVKPKAGEKKTEAVTPEAVEVTDEAIQKEVETKMQGQPAEVKEAFAASRRAERQARRDAKQVATKISELEAQLTQAKADAAKAPTQLVTDSTEVESLRQQIQNYEQELSVAKIEATSEFKKAVTEPRTKISQLVDTLAKKTGQKSVDLMAALTDNTENQGELMDAVMENMTNFDKGRFTNLIAELAKTSDAEAVLREKSKEALAKIGQKTTEQTEAQKQAAKQAAEKATGETWTALATELPDVLKTYEGDDETVTAWNAAVTAAQKNAGEIDYSTLDASGQAQVRSRAAVFPLLVGSLKSVEAELTALQTEHNAAMVELDKFRKATPGLDAGKLETEPVAKDKGKDWVTRTNERFAKIGA